MYGKFHTINTCIQIEKGHDYIRIYDGGSQYSEVFETFSGIHNQTKVLVPGNQVFISFEAKAMSDNEKKGFVALIVDKGNFYINFFLGGILEV